MACLGPERTVRWRFQPAMLSEAPITREITQLLRRWKDGDREGLVSSTNPGGLQFRPSGPGSRDRYNKQRTALNCCLKKTRFTMDTSASAVWAASATRRPGRRPQLSPRYLRFLNRGVLDRTRPLVSNAILLNWVDFIMVLPF